MCFDYDIDNLSHNHPQLTQHQKSYINMGPVDKVDYDPHMKKKVHQPHYNYHCLRTKHRNRSK